MTDHGTSAWLVNTGWVGGGYGKGGQRIDLPSTRKIIDAILEGDLDDVGYETLPIFNLEMPIEVPGVDSSILNPRNVWSDPKEWDEQAKNLAMRFIKNFERFTDSEATKRLIAAGPQCC